MLDGHCVLMSLELSNISLAVNGPKGCSLVVKAFLPPTIGSASDSSVDIIMTARAMTILIEGLVERGMEGGLQYKMK